MKKTLLATLLTFSVLVASAHADSVPAPNDSQLPSRIACSTKDPDARGNFEITAFNSDQADWNRDGNFMGRTRNAFSYQIGFSNECDNDYVFLFFVDDLSALAAGKVPSITGMLRYTNADLSDSSEPVPTTGYRTVELSCTLLNPAH